MFVYLFDYRRAGLDRPEVAAETTVNCAYATTGELASRPKKKPAVFAFKVPQAKRTLVESAVAKVEPAPQLKKFGLELKAHARSSRTHAVPAAASKLQAVLVVLHHTRDHWGEGVLSAHTVGQTKSVVAPRRHA